MKGHKLEHDGYLTNQRSVTLGHATSAMSLPR